MTDQSGSTRFRVRLESALQTYRQTTGVTLAEHPLAVQLLGCNEVESITTILKREAQASTDLLGSDKIMTLIESIVAILSTLSATASFRDAIGLPYPPAKAILAGLAILFAAARGVNSNHNGFVGLLEPIEQLLQRVEIYTRIPPTPRADETVFKIIVELLCTLALATKELKHGRSMKLVKKGEKSVEAVLQRIDRLTQDEARTTATETLEVIHGLFQNMRVVMDDGKASADGVREALEILHQMVCDKNKSKRDELRKDIRSWLSPPDPWKNHNIARESRQSGTGAWFLQGDAISEWKSSGRNCLLWIHGKPGAGKSVLCSTIIEDIETMRKSGLASLAMFYCDFREDQKKDLRGLLSSMLFQLCDQSDSYHDILSNLYSIHRDGAQSPSDDELARCLKGLLELPGQAPVYLIIDALDECPNTSTMPSPREKVLALVVQLVESRHDNLHICITSRPETDIKGVLGPLTSHSVSIHDESGQIEDIENYIKSVVDMDPRNRRWKAEDKQLVIEALIARADGMFRWVYCQLAYLRGCQPGRIRHALAALPATLDETYERTLREINEADAELAHRLFQCVAVVCRPLSVEELAEFLAFDFNPGQIPKFREDWRPEDPLEAVLSTCSTLLSLVSVDGLAVIQFSHFSVKEFLTSPRFAEKCDTTSHRYHVSMAPAHSVVAQACLGLLMHLDENITRDSLDRFPLAKYAAEHWVEHARFERVSPDTEEAMKQLFDPSKPHFAVWLWIHNPIPMPDARGKRPSPPPGTPLHYAAFCGLHIVVKALVIEHPRNVHSWDLYDHSTPLHLASRRGNTEVARVLVKHGADVSAKEKDGLTPLHWALEIGHVDVARFLVECGADIFSKDKWGLTPLHRASSRGHIDLARSLIERGADISAKSEDGSTPLHMASSYGRMDLVRSLVDHGADLSAKSEDGSTPLHIASCYGHTDLARFLVEHGASVCAMDNCGSTPLHRASSRGHMDLAWFLIEHGADMSAKSEDGSTLLHMASANGHSDLVRFLVEHGADMSAKSVDGLTPLHIVSLNGYVDPARFFVENGADISAKDKWGLTPLHRTSVHGYIDLARLLVEHGADMSAKSEFGMTPLHMASLKGHINLARFLVEHGADVSAEDMWGLTPLHRASFYGYTDLARFFIEDGADVSAKDKWGFTPLHRASFHNYIDLARLLVEHGAHMSAKSKDGLTLLHMASFNGHVDLARFLIKDGADVSAEDMWGLTPLHRASFHGYIDFARFLVEHGADVSAEDNWGFTPLHRVSSHGYIDVMQFLVEHGADLSAKSKDGLTPLHMASFHGCVDLARFLVEHGADVSAEDKWGLTPLHRASSHGYIDIMRLLVEHGTDSTS